MTYYGFIEEIWELDYDRLKVALFRCQCVWLEEITTDREGFTIVDLTKTAYRDDPFVLTKDIMQIFYAGDNKTKEKLKVVLQGKRKIAGVDGVTDEEDYRGYQKMHAFGVNVPYLSLKRVTNLLTSVVIAMRPSLLDPMKIVRLLLTM